VTRALRHFGQCETDRTQAGQAVRGDAGDVTGRSSRRRSLLTIPLRLYDWRMCRNITELRGLEPPATREEIDAAAKQFIRKVTGITKPNVALVAAMEEASLEIADITERLLAGLPPRRQPPKTLPPLRRPEVRNRLGLAPFPS
jgi:hypothetical protein